MIMMHMISILQLLTAIEIFILKCSEGSNNLPNLNFERTNQQQASQPPVRLSQLNLASLQANADDHDHSRMNAPRNMFVDPQANNNNDAYVIDASSRLTVDHIKQNAIYFLNSINQTQWPTSANDILSNHCMINTNQLIDEMELAYPIFHEETIMQISLFLKAKTNPRNPRSDEKQYFSRFRNATGHIKLSSYFNRLLTKKAIYFYTKYDKYQLLDGKKGIDDWDMLDDSIPANFENHLTYDEMMFNAQAGISSPTQFINNCGKDNAGIPDGNDSNFEKNGIFIGMVGARFEKQGRMEYEEYAILESGTDDESEYISTSSKVMKTEMYSLDTERLSQERLTVSLELFLFDANERGMQFQTSKVKAYLASIGTEFWAPLLVSTGQYDNDIINKLIYEVTCDIIRSTYLPHIDTIEFGFELPAQIPKLHAIHDAGRRHRITLLYGNEYPAAKIKCQDNNDDQDCGNHLLVSMYSSDSNALAGNEYWDGLLTRTSNSAAAACSTIALTQNPYINGRYINGDNVKVYRRSQDEKHYEIVPLSYYHQRLR